jgi:integral membrane sensor domain MASE1
MSPFSAPPDRDPPSAAVLVFLLPTACLLAALAGVVASREPGGVAAVWLPNAVLLGAMLRWGIGWGPPAVLAVAAVGLANLLAGDGPALAVGFAAANAAEVAVGRAVARRLRTAGRWGEAGIATATLAAATLAAPLAGARADCISV